MINGRIGFGIIGCGKISEFHINAIEELKDKAFLVGVTDKIRASAEKISDCHGGIRIFDSVDDLLACEDVDAVCICTPSGFHAETIIKASNAGKNIVVEKPLAITKEQLDSVEEVCKRNNTLLAVISQLRFSDDIKKAKEAVMAGQLGRIVCADMYMKYLRTQEYYDSGAWRGTKAIDGGGALMNQGIHGIDLLQYIAGDVKSVFAYSGTLARNIEVEDTLCAAIEFESGAFGVIQAATSVYPGYPRRLEINGTNGSITVEESSITKMDIFGDTDKSHSFVQSVISGASVAMNISNDYHKLQIEDFIDSINSNRRPLVDLTEGRKAVDIVLAIYKSAAEGRKVYVNEMKS